MSRWSFFLALIREARTGPYIRFLLTIWGAVGVFSTIKGEFFGKNLKWGDTRLIDWIPSMSLQAWLIVGLVLIIGIVFEAAHRLHVRQSEELATLQAAEISGLPPAMGQTMEIVSETAQPGSYGNLPYGLRVIVRPRAPINTVMSSGGPVFSMTVYVNDRYAVVDIEPPNGLRTTSSSSDAIGMAGRTRVAFVGRGLSQEDVVTMIVSSMGQVKVLRVDAG